MSSWNYRVIERDGEFAIYEVFYSDNGDVKGHTEEPVFPRAESVDDLRNELQRYSEALNKEVLPYSAGE